MFSKACEYGIKACLFIAEDKEGRKSYDVRTIAQHINSPEAFTAKILQKLKKEAIVDSQIGVRGGYFLKNNLSCITLDQIVDSIDGDGIYKGCALGLITCNASKPCPVHNNFVKIREDLKEMLESTTVEDLKNELVNGNTFLTR